ncbi:hypothetical protein NPIL_604761 [Nephila pilipes]|uniref:Uncharacterized protein n=1 Tax=Nephila pilipes TaxID=299642 RepID=A0A8X6M6B9_NEPPI|nr:hypothetical protein NPIL_604761 [Nephila pilipes]
MRFLPSKTKSSMVPGILAENDALTVPPVSFKMPEKELLQIPLEGSPGSGYSSPLSNAEYNSDLRSPFWMSSVEYKSFPVYGSEANWISQQPISEDPSTVVDYYLLSKLPIEESASDVSPASEVLPEYIGHCSDINFRVKTLLPDKADAFDSYDKPLYKDLEKQSVSEIDSQQRKMAKNFEMVEYYKKKVKKWGMIVFLTSLLAMISWNTYSDVRCWNKCTSPMMLSYIIVIGLFNFAIFLSEIVSIAFPRFETSGSRNSFMKGLCILPLVGGVCMIIETVLNFGACGTRGVFFPSGYILSFVIMGVHIVCTSTGLVILSWVDVF